MNEFFPLASAAGMTVGLAVCALIVGLALAMFFAVWESAKWRPVAWAGSALVTILRGLPEILVVLFIYFGSSQLLLTLSDGFTINLGFVQIPVQMDIENFEDIDAQGQPFPEPAAVSEDDTGEDAVDALEEDVLESPITDKTISRRQLMTGFRG